MPSTISLNTIPLGAQGVTNFVNNVGLSNSTLFASTLRDIVTNGSFPGLFSPSSIDSSKLAPVPGNKVITRSLSGSKGMTNGGQVAWYSIDTIDIADQAIDSRTIKDDSVGNGKLGTMAANTVKVNNTAATANPADLNVGSNSVLGRSGTGNISSIAAGDNGVLRRDGSGNLSFGLIGANNIEAGSSFFPGMIVMWSGAIGNIPTGWGFCNGTTYTFDGRTTISPDLRDKFIVGAFQDVSGEARTNVTGSLTKVGGSNNHSHTISQISAIASNGAIGSHTLTIEQIPSHTHTGTIAGGSHSHGITDPGHNHTVFTDDNTGASGSGNPDANAGSVPRSTTSTNRTNITINSADHTHTLTINAAGGLGGVTQPHNHSFTQPTISVTAPSSTGGANNIPSYYALAFIIKL
jgi:hypothetical protein